MLVTISTSLFSLQRTALYIWNNKNIRIDGKPVFYKSYYDSGICNIEDLLFNLDNIESFNAINNIVEKANVLTWTGLRHAIPSILKTIEYTTFTENTYFTKGNEIFDKAERLLLLMLLLFH